jgi:hypothetical protein
MRAMRSHNRQEIFLRFERLGESRPRIRGLTVLISLFAVGAICAVTLRSLVVFPKTITSEEKSGSDFVRYGFAVQQSRFGHGTFLHLWTRVAGGNFEQEVWLNMRKLDVAQLKQTAWLANYQAVLLDIDMKHNFGSYDAPEEHWVLYNFRSGGLRSCNSSEPNSCASLQAYVKKIAER